MKTVSIHDAKSNLSKYISAAKKGHKIYIGSFGNPEVVLLKTSMINSSKTRDFSKAHNMIKEHKDSFSNSTEEIVSDLLYG